MSETETPRNGIVAPEFGEAEVRAGNNSTLVKLLKYLKSLCTADPYDVRDYMAKVEFKKGWEKKLPVDDDFSDNEAASSEDGLDDMFLKLAVSEPTPVHKEEGEGSKTRITPGPSLTLEKVPFGTSVDFICLEGKFTVDCLRSMPEKLFHFKRKLTIVHLIICYDFFGMRSLLLLLGTDFVMKGRTPASGSGVKHFSIRGPAIKGVRIEKKMNLDLLVSSVGREKLTFAEDK